MRRHASWFLPIAIIPALYIAFLLLLEAAADVEPRTSEEQIQHVALFLIGSAALAAGAIACAIIAIINGVRGVNHWRRSRGWLTESERRARDDARWHQEGWVEAVRLVDDIRCERMPQPLRQWSIVPYADEHFFFEVPAQYQRFAGARVEYSQSAGVFVGHPTFLLAGLVGTAISNAAARSAAVRRAAEQWREHEHTRVLVSNRRLVVLVRGQWVTFDFAAITASYPMPEHWSITLEFDSAAPMRLVGRGAPLISAWVVLALMGCDGVEHHPALATLRGGPRATALGAP